MSCSYCQIPNLFSFVIIHKQKNHSFDLLKSSFKTVIKCTLNALEKLKATEMVLSSSCLKNSHSKVHVKYLYKA